MLTGLDIFCGVGGSSTGARQAGVNLLGAIDMCPVATATYKANFPGVKVLTDRLEAIDPLGLKEQLGQVDILLASPECTNHTCAKGAAPRDENSRATAMQVVRFARALRPRWLVLENVVHMRPWSRYGELKKALESSGYNVGEQVLDSADFGVPQSRRRLFLVGDRKRKPTLVSVRGRHKVKTAKSILDPKGTWPTSPLLAHGRAQDTLDRAARAVATLGPDADFLIVYYGTDGSGGWQPLDRPLRTITTIDRFALVTPESDGHAMRMLQVPELKKAMGFPNSFRLPTGTRRDRIRLLGNAVCPPVMKAVVSALLS